jgi:hypothetical protein
VTAIHDEAVGHRTGTGQRVGERRPARAAKQEGGPGNTDAPAEHRPAADHVAAQDLLEEFMLLHHRNWGSTVGHFSSFVPLIRLPLTDV